MMNRLREVGAPILQHGDSIEISN